MDFRLLGPLEVVEHGRSLVLGGTKQRALLALLVLHAGEVVATERLIDDLWGESPPATVAKSIHVYVSRLRGQLGEDRILTRTPGYALRAEPSEIDAVRFEGLVAEAGHAEPRHAAELLRRALDLWRGPALADLAYQPFAQGAIARLEELRLAALERRLEADLAGGRHADVVGELEMLAAEHPLREGVHGQLMTRAVPLRPAGRGPRRLSGCPPGAGRRAGRRARTGAARAPPGDPRAGPALDAGSGRRRAERGRRAVRGPRARAGRALRGARRRARGPRAHRARGG